MCSCTILRHFRQPLPDPLYQVPRGIADVAAVPSLRSLRLPSASSRTALLTVALVLLSLSPGSWKVHMHTRGPLHMWAHLGLFSALSGSAMQKSPNFRARLLGILSTGLLGCLLECLEAGGQSSRVETNDVFANLLGVSLGMVIFFGASVAHRALQAAAIPLRFCTGEIRGRLCRRWRHVDLGRHRSRSFRALGREPLQPRDAAVCGRSVQDNAPRCLCS